MNWRRLGVGVVAGLGLVSACSSEGEVAESSHGAGGFGGSAGSAGTGASGGSAASGGTGNVINVPDAPPPDVDSDGDGLLDSEEGMGDSDGDGIANKDDPINDGDPPAIKLTGISTTFNSPIGIDFHEPTKSVVVSVNYPTGVPSGFERIELDGSHQQFSNLSGLSEEVKIATARSGNPQGFAPGDLFVGNGVDGQIVRIVADGSMMVNPWVDLPGDNNGLMRGSLYIDRTGEWAGDLIAATTAGEVWRVTVAGVPTRLAAVGVHLEGVITVPNKPARFGPLAGKLIIGAEAQQHLYVFSQDGSFETLSLGVAVEDIDLVNPKENFFGVNYGTSSILGAEAAQFGAMLGDVILAQEGVTAGTTGLFRLKWDGTQVVAQPIPLDAASAPVGQWEHVTFAGAGILEVPPVPE